MHWMELQKAMLLYMMTAVIVPIDKDVREERFVRLINKYNEKKGYRWEIQKTIISKAPLPRMDNGDIDQNSIETLIANEK